MKPLTFEQIQPAVLRRFGPDVRTELFSCNERVYVKVEAEDAEVIYRYLPTCEHPEYAFMTAADVRTDEDWRAQRRRLLPVERRLRRVGVRVERDQLGGPGFRLVRVMDGSPLQVDLGDGELRDLLTIDQLHSLEPSIFRLPQRASAGGAA